MEALELELRLELNDSGRSVCTQTGAVDCGRRANRRGKNFPKLLARYVRDREAEIGMVKEVEESRSHGELSALPLGYTKALLDAEIRIEETGSTERITTNGSVVAHGIGEAAG